MDMNIIIKAGKETGFETKKRGHDYRKEKHCEYRKILEITDTSEVVIRNSCVIHEKTLMKSLNLTLILNKVSFCSFLLKVVLYDMVLFLIMYNVVRIRDAAFVIIMCVLPTEFV